MILPTKLNKPEQGFPKGKTWLLFGPQKVGKTVLAAGFPDALILDLQKGAYHINNAYVIDIVEEAKKAGTSNMDALRDAFDLIIGPAGKMYQTIVVDTIDEVYDWSETEACAHLTKKLKTQIDTVEEAPHGAGWGEARRRLMGFVEACRVVGKNVLFMAHTKTVSSESGTVSQKAKTIDLPGKLASRLPAKVDIIGFCYAVKEGVGVKREIKRYISFEPYDEIEAGCRYKELNGKVIPMSFKAIEACFDKPAGKK